MPFDKGIADRLRKAGLSVKEVEGWKTRGNRSGSHFYPACHVIHHTAGAPPSYGMTPSLRICIYGRSDLPGPLCNWYLGYDNNAYVIAAGAANHAGRGGWKGVSGNSRSWGVEVEHPGTYALDSERAELVARGVAAVIQGTIDESMVCQHKEWNPAQKIDLATSPTAGWFRTRVGHYLKGGSTDVTVPAWYWDWSAWYLNTSRKTEERPPNTPAQIPAWAWEYNKEDSAIANNHGMSQGERDWINWKLAGEKGERPAVPDKIPEFWWNDLKFVQGKVTA